MVSKSQPCVIIFWRTQTHTQRERTHTSLHCHAHRTICSNDSWCDWISLHGHWAVCPIPHAAYLVSNEDAVTMWRLWGSGGAILEYWPSNSFLFCYFLFPSCSSFPVMSFISLLSNHLFPLQSPSYIMWFRISDGWFPWCVIFISWPKSPSVIYLPTSFPLWPSSCFLFLSFVSFYLGFILCRGQTSRYQRDNNNQEDAGPLVGSENRVWQLIISSPLVCHNGQEPTLHPGSLTTERLACLIFYSPPTMACQ